jgi:hypothetical protein
MISSRNKAKLKKEKAKAKKTKPTINTVPEVKEKELELSSELKTVTVSSHPSPSKIAETKPDTTTDKVVDPSIYSKLFFKGTKGSVDDMQSLQKLFKHFDTFGADSVLKGGLVLRYMWFHFFLEEIQHNLSEVDPEKAEGAWLHAGLNDYDSVTKSSNYIKLCNIHQYLSANNNFTARDINNTFIAGNINDPKKFKFAQFGSTAFGCPVDCNLQYSINYRSSYDQFLANGELRIFGDKCPDDVDKKTILTFAPGCNLGIINFEPFIQGSRHLYKNNTMVVKAPIMGLPNYICFTAKMMTKCNTLINAGENKKTLTFKWIDDYTEYSTPPFIKNEKSVMDLKQIENQFMEYCKIMLRYPSMEDTCYFWVIQCARRNINMLDPFVYPFFKALMVNRMGGFFCREEMDAIAKNTIEKLQKIYDQKPKDWKPPVPGLRQQLDLTLSHTISAFQQGFFTIPSNTSEVDSAQNGELAKKHNVSTK